MQLAVDGKSIARESLDQVQFPERPRQVHRNGVQAGHQHAQFALPARVRQRRMTQVIVDVGIVDDLPARQQRAGQSAGTDR